MLKTTIDTILARYTCRGYTDKTLAAEDLQTIARAAVAAPSGMNLQPWRVVVLTNKALIEEMDAAALKGIADVLGASTYERIQGRGGKVFYHAPAIFFIAVENDAKRKADIMTNCGIVAQNIALAATALGLGSCICGLAGCAFYGEAGQAFKQRLGFPEGFDFGLAVLVGYAKESGTPHAPDLAKVSFIE